MQPQTIIRTPGPASFLALVPHLIGMEPVDSLVVIPFEGKRTAGGLRVDLPASSAATAGLGTYVSGLLGRLRGVDGVVVIIYVSSASDLLPQRDLVEVVVRRLRHAGFLIKDAFCVAGQDWASYLSPSGRVIMSAAWERLDAAPPGIPLPELLPPLAYEPASPEVVAAVELEVANAAGDWTSDHVELALGWTEAELSGGRGLMIAALQDPSARDETMLQWASEPFIQPEIQLIGGLGPQPDRDRLVTAIALLTRLRQVAAPRLQPPLLCMLAWLSWAMGSGSRADQYLDASFLIEPDYPMASVLRSLVSSGRVPEWLLSR